jgi:sporulation protein YlmC with PRC-barrel domain
MVSILTDHHETQAAEEDDMANEMDRVVPLDELDDYEVAEGDPDVRGWEVLSADGRKIGEVDNLLVDTAAMKVRYLDVDVDDEMMAGNEDRHILIPIGYARLHEDDDQVLVDTLNSTDVRTLPAYTHEPLTRDYESSVRERFDTGYTAGVASGASGDFYGSELYDQNRFYGSRRGGSNLGAEDMRAAAGGSSVGGANPGGLGASGPTGNPGGMSAGGSTADQPLGKPAIGDPDRDRGGMNDRNENLDNR